MRSITTAPPVKHRSIPLPRSKCQPTSYHSFLCILGSLLQMSAVPTIAPGQELQLMTRTLGTTASFRTSGELANPAVCVTMPSILSVETIEPAVGRRLWWISSDDPQLHAIAPRGRADDLGAISDRELVWRPLERHGKTWFVFVSNGLEANDDIYLGNLTDPLYMRLTTHEEVDQHPHWSPDGTSLAFVSGRSGGGDVYKIPHMLALMDTYEEIVRSGLVDGIPLRNLEAPIIEGKSREENHVRLTSNPGLDTHPAWSPSGRYLAYQASIPQDATQRMDICIIDLFDPALKSANLTSTPSADELQPSWSPDGESIAFYRSHAALGDDPPDRVGLAAMRVFFGSVCSHRWPPQSMLYPVADDVRRNIYKGPCWGPQSHSLTYIRTRERETSLHTATLGPTHPTVTSVLLFVGDRTGLYQDRSLSLAATSRGAAVGLVSFEGQEYHLRYAMDQQGALSIDSEPPAVVIQRKHSWTDRISFGLSQMPVFGIDMGSRQKTTWGLYSFGRYSFPTFCVGELPLQAALAVGYGIVLLPRLPSQPSSYEFGELHLQIGHDLFLGRYATTLFLLGGVGYAFEPPTYSTPGSSSDNLLWPIGIGATIGQAAGKRICFTIMAIMRFTNHPVGRVSTAIEGRQHDSYLSIHLGFTFALSAMRES